MKIYAMTDVGRRREVNQDYVYVTDRPIGPFPNLLTVADGMGGHKAGDFASSYTVNVLKDELKKTPMDKPEEILRSVVSIANHKLIEAASRDIKLEGMGTTLVAATVVGNTLYFANVGDSRLYLINDKIRQLSKDHSLVEEMVRLGGIKAEEARNHPDKNIITVLCFQRKNEVFYRCKWIFRWNVDFMKQILKIAIPNGMENGIFQLVKVALSGIVALFGTYQIAANGVAQSIWSLAALAGVAMGPVFITVIGQCIGNGDADAAEHYFKRLTRITLLISSAWNLLIFLLTPFFMKFYALQPETKRLVIWLVLIHNVFNATAYPFSGALSNGLRAAGDVKFTMYVSVISTIAVRLLLSWLLGIVLKMGVIGIAIAMVCDWSIRAVIFFWRQKSGKWKTFQVI